MMTFVNVKPMERIIARLRARGFTVNEHPGWRTRGVNGRDMNRAQALLMHHDVSKPPGNYPLGWMIRDGRSDLDGPLSQWGVGRQGTIEVIAAGLAYHAGKTRNSWSGNTRAQGCEAANRGTGSVGNPDEPWPAASMAAQRALAEEFMREYGVGTNRIRGHKEECLPAGRKIDPVYDMNAFRRSLSDKPTIPAVPLPVIEQEDDDMTPEQAERQARIENKLDTLLSKHEAVTKVVADILGHVKTTREFFQPGGFIRAKIDNIEAVAARGKNLTIDVVGAAGVLVSDVKDVPRETVNALAAKLSQTAADEPRATTTKENGR